MNIIGDTFVLPHNQDVTVEWLAVQFHPNSKEVVQVVAVADFPLSCWADVDVDRLPLMARTWCLDWLDASLFTEDRRTGSVPGPCLNTVKRTLSAFVSNNTLPGEAIPGDDPDWEEFSLSLYSALADLRNLNHPFARSMECASSS